MIRYNKLYHHIIIWPHYHQLASDSTIEKEEWKLFRNALDKSDRKKFDEMWDIPRLYVSACSNSCQLVPLHPIVMSILFHHYKELKECMSEVEQIEARANDNSRKKNKKCLQLLWRESYFVKNNAYISNNKYYSFSLFFPTVFYFFVRRKDNT
jgi:hypothetical protein